MPLRRIWDTSANITLSSDWDVNELNPLITISNSLKLGARGLPDVFSAIDAYTVNAAKALGLEEITGSIEVGKSADFVILDEDITKLPIENIPDAKILMTILQGEIVFSETEN